MDAINETGSRQMRGGMHLRWRRGGEGRELPLGAVEKADLVLGSFPPDRACVGVTELSRRCGLPKSTTHRVLAVLETIGMVMHVPAGYRLGYRLHELADIADGRRPSEVRECALPYLLDLYEKTHLTVHLGVWTGDEVFIAERLHGRVGPCVPPPVGAKVSAYSYALVKILLAYLDESAVWQARKYIRHTARPAVQAWSLRLEKELRTVRQQGIAVSSDDMPAAVACIAVPVRGPWRPPVAAISVSGHHKRLDTSAVVHQLRQAAHATSLAWRKSSSTVVPGRQVTERS